MAKEVTELPASCLLDICNAMIYLCEQDEKEEFMAFQNNLKEKYGNMGLLYLQELAELIANTILKFTKYSKRTICTAAIIKSKSLDES